MKRQPVFSVRTRRRSAGAGIVTAIFLLVVLAGLGVAMVSLSTTQRQGILLDEQGARAYQAARAGIEWGLFQRLRGTGCASGTTTAVALGGDVLRDFALDVTCTRIAGPASNDPAVNLDRWVIRALACAPATAGRCPDGSGNPDYVRRVVEVQL